MKSEPYSMIRPAHFYFPLSFKDNLITTVITIHPLEKAPLQRMLRRISHRDSKFNKNSMVMVVSGGVHHAVLLQHKKRQA